MNDLDVHELAKKKFSEPTVLIWDVRTPAEFSAGRVPGAINLPLGSGALANAIATHREQAAAVCFICAAGGRSRQAAQQAIAAGWSAGISVDGGTRAWTEAGLPIEKSAQASSTISLERQVRIAAGTLVLTGVVLGTWVRAGFYGLSGFVGAGLIFAGATDWCGLGLLLARLPWNQR